MSHQQLHDFASTPNAGLPEHKVDGGMTNKNFQQAETIRSGRRPSWMDRSQKMMADGGTGSDGGIKLNPGYIEQQYADAAKRTSDARSAYYDAVSKRRDPYAQARQDYYNSRSAYYADPLLGAPQIDPSTAAVNVPGAITPTGQPSPPHMADGRKATGVYRVRATKVTAQPMMADGKKPERWAAGAFAHAGEPGHSLHATLGVPKDEKIPADKIQKALHSSNLHTKRMALAAHNI